MKDNHQKRLTKEIRGRLSQYDGVSGIYRIESKSNGKCYIGQSQNIFKRLCRHVALMTSDNKSSNVKLLRHFKKYGISDFDFGVLLKVDGIENLNFYEKFFIKCFDSKSNGFNIQDGGRQFSKSKRKVGGTLKNYKTGETLHFESIKDFCHDKSLVPTSVSRLLRKKIRYHGDWCLPNDNRIKYELLSPSGERITTYNLSGLAKENSLIETNLHAVYRGKVLSCGGWKKFKEESHA